MKHKLPKRAGLISVLLAVVMILAIYTLLGTVDLVFLKPDGKEISYQEDVNVFSTIHLPEGELSYTMSGETKNLDSVTDLKVDIGMTVLTNFLTFNWDEDAGLIEITVVQE